MSERVRFMQVISKPENMRTYENVESSKCNEVLELISTSGNKTQTFICLGYSDSFDEEHKRDNKKIMTEDASIVKRCSYSTYDDVNPLNLEADSFILKLLSDPYLGDLFYGLEMKTIAEIIKNSLAQLPIQNNNQLKDMKTGKPFSNQLHHIIREERCKLEFRKATGQPPIISIQNTTNIPCIEHPEESGVKLERINENHKVVSTRKINEMQANFPFWKNCDSLLSSQNDNKYECLKYDPIYEEISEEPPPLPTNPPPMKNDTTDTTIKPMFLGATKNDILSYLVGAKDRINVPEESYTFKFLRNSKGVESESECISEKNIRPNNFDRGKSSNMNAYNWKTERIITSIERNDSGVGSETSKIFRTKYQPGNFDNNIVPPIHLCEDCGNSFLTMFRTHYKFTWAIG